MKFKESWVIYAAGVNEDNVRRLASFLNKNGWDKIRAEGSIDDILRSIHNSGFYVETNSFPPNYFRGKVS